MECKDQRLVETHGQQVSIDLTRMECKGIISSMCPKSASSIDLTRMECKASFRDVDMCPRCV